MGFMAGNTVRRYRDRNTGQIDYFPESVADAYDYLEEVDEDALPLAYTPISQVEIDDYIAAQAPIDPPINDEGNEPEKGQD